jgi:hypothetical protein
MNADGDIVLCPQDFDATGFGAFPGLYYHFHMISKHRPDSLGTELGEPIRG